MRDPKLLTTGLLSAMLALAACSRPAPAQQGAGDKPVRPAKWAEPLEVPGLPNLHRVSGALYRSAQPSAEGMRRAEAMGIKTVVNLRSAHSDRDELEGTKLAYEHIHFNTFNTEREEVVRFLKIMADGGRHPVLVHCKHGADRTGLMAAFYRMVFQEWSKEEALREMTEGGFGYHPIWSNLPSFIREENIEKLKQDVGVQ